MQLIAVFKIIIRWDSQDWRYNSDVNPNIYESDAFHGLISLC